jgi:hypothetical protein
MQLIEEQIARVDQPIHALLLVGGFAGSEYLKQRVHDQFNSRVRLIARPPDADTATLRGAAAYGLARRPLVSSVIAPRSYLMKVKLPAEQEDWLKRPAYIRSNDAGVSICENRSVAPSRLCCVLVLGVLIWLQIAVPRFERSNPEERVCVISSLTCVMINQFCLLPALSQRLTTKFWFVLCH